MMAKVFFIDCSRTIHQTAVVDPMLIQSWATVYDDVPTLNQHWVDVSYLQDTIASNEIGRANIVSLILNKMS